MQKRIGIFGGGREVIYISRRYNMKHLARGRWPANAKYSEFLMKFDGILYLIYF